MAGENGAGPGSNPYPRKVNGHANWEAGRQAAIADFERDIERHNRPPCVFDVMLSILFVVVVFSALIALGLKVLIWLSEIFHEFTF